jgi:hypothetical protein
VTRVTHISYIRIPIFKKNFFPSDLRIEEERVTRVTCALHEEGR